MTWRHRHNHPVTQDGSDDKVFVKDDSNLGGGVMLQFSHLYSSFLAPILLFSHTLVNKDRSQNIVRMSHSKNHM